jgi:pimeloyl-ACP methyl ester carboxylesterase
VAAVELNGASIAYDEAGSGSPAFVFVHGWVCDRSFWQPQFEDLSRDHRCIAVDLRGCGESTGPAPYDAVTAADDVAALIGHLQAGPAVIVGHSLGGIVSLLLNERYPDLVLGVLLGDPPLSSAAAFPRPVQAIRNAASIEPMRRGIEGFFGPGTPAGVRSHVESVMLSAAPDVAAGMLDNSEAYASRLDDLLKLADQKPLMAIWPARPMGDPAHLRDITVFIRQEPIPGAAHFFQLEKPAITNALLRAFLDDVERDPRLGKVD